MSGVASNAVSSQGTKFFRWTSSAWVELAEVVSIEGPSKTRDTIEVTTLNSLDGYKEFIAGLRDGGNVVLSMNFTNATYAILNDDFEDDTIQNYAIVLPDTSVTTLELEGFVIELPLTAVTNDKLTANATIKVTKKPTLGYGSSGEFPGVTGI